MSAAPARRAAPARAAATATTATSAARPPHRARRSDPAARTQVDFERLRTEVLRQLPRLYRRLFPAGRIEGPEFVVGSLAGEPGRSFKIRLTGPRAGVWKDFAVGVAGRDPIALVAAINGMSRVQAAVALAMILGIDPWRRA